MRKKIIHSGIIAIIFISALSFAVEQKEKEIEELEKRVEEAKQKINDAETFKLNDLLSFLPTVSISRRAPYDEIQTKETYVSASIQLNKLFDINENKNKRETEKRKALKKIETIKYTITKLIERKYMIIDTIRKLEKIIQGTDDVLEAAAKQEQIDKLQLQLNELQIDIQKKYYEMDEVVIDIVGSTKPLH